MKKAQTCLVAAIGLFAASVAFAADPNVGTWKLDESKSQISAGASKNTMVTYTAEGDGFKCTVEGVDGKGARLANQWSGKFDGKDYAVTGDPTADTRAIKMVSPDHYELTTKKGGATTATGTIVMVGKTRTLTIQGTDAGGNKVTNTYVYERQ